MTNPEASKTTDPVVAPPGWPAGPLVRRLQRLIEIVGHLVSWIWVVLLGVIVLNVVLRYAFGEGRVLFEEIQWHLYAVGFLLGLGWGVGSEAHIRVDLFHERMRPRHRAWVELYGIALLLVPFCLLVLVAAVPFVTYAWETAEVSASPDGLPLRWLIKAALPLGFLILLLAALARAAQAWQVITRTDPAAPVQAADGEDAP